MKQDKICAIVALSASVLAIILWFFLPSITRDYGESVRETNTSISGLQLIFTSDFLRIGFIFAVVGLILSTLIVTGNKSKALPAVSLVCFAFVALFCFLTLKSYTAAYNSLNYSSYDTRYLKLGTGAILAGLLFTGAAITMLFSIINTSLLANAKNEQEPNKEQE